MQPAPGEFAAWRAKQPPERGSSAGASRRHLLLDVAGAVDSARRTALRAAGIELLDWLEGTLFAASISMEGRFAGDPSGVGPSLGLRSAGEFPPQEKISDWFTGNTVPEWSRSEWRGQPSYDVAVVLHRDAPVEETSRALQAAGWGILSESVDFQRITARVPEKEIARLAGFDAVLHIEPIAPPIQDSDNAVSAAMLKGSVLQAAPFNLTGKDVRLAIIDSGRVSVHQDLRGRVTNLENYNFDSAHSTHVAGTMAGNGASDPARKGLAPEAQLYWGTYSGDYLGKTRTAITSHNVVAVNNSWGYGMSGAACNLAGGYTADARDYDRLVRETPASIVFSMGNDRDGYGCPLFPTRGGFYSTGVPASSKNVISVGAVARSTVMSDFGNYGPTRDGRLKPDIVALGVDVQSLGLRDDGATMSGTSMSAPAVTGSIALLSQRLQEKQSNTKPAPALMKALLLGTARDLGNTGPDYSYGFGIPDLIEAVQSIDNKQFELASLQGGEWTKSITAPGGAKALRVTIAWSDPEGPLNSRAALVNDLDLSVQAPGEEKARLPLTLDPFKPAAPAQEAVNRRDNVEQVLILNPPAGEFTIRVNVNRLATDAQEFAVVWSFAEVGTPPCLTAASPMDFVAAETGGIGAMAITRPAHCEPVELENPSGWITTNQVGPITGTGPIKLTAAPNQSEGTRYTMLRAGEAEIRFRQSGPCALQPLPADGAVEIETSLYDCIYLGDYTKVYTFEGQAGQKVRIRFGSPYFDSYAALRAPNGTSLGATFAGAGLEGSLPTGVSMLTLPATGRYMIYLSGLDENYGLLRMKVEFGDRDPAEGRPDIPALITECPFQAEGVLGEGSTDTGRRGDLYLTNSYLFKGYAGQRIEVQLTEPEFDSYLYLISPNGSLVAQNDDALSGTGSTLTYTLAEGGEWRLEVTSFAPFATGKYQLSVRGCSARAK